MRVAILMSVYNGEKFIGKQLESLYNQTIKNSLKIYIRDDGSRDRTLEIISLWKKSLDIVLLKGENIGPAKSFWAMLTDKSIDADFFAFCDQDDIWDNDKLEIAIGHLNQATHLYASNCRTIDENEAIISNIRLITPPKIEIQTLFVAGVAQGCAMVFTKELRDFILDKGITCIPMHDIILMLYALNYGDMYWDHTPHFSYRLHSDNVVAKRNKNIYKKILTVYWNWKNSGNNSMSDVARELLINQKNLTKEEIVFLENVRDYKRIAKSKFAILWNDKIKHANKHCLFSYRARIILNLL